MDEPNYRKLIVWQKAHQNALTIIDLLDSCNSKHARIINQCIASSTSIGANIAEGNSAHTDREKKRYFGIAHNSSYEFDNWLQILQDSRTICSDRESLISIEKQNVEIIKILSKLISGLKS